MTCCGRIVGRGSGIHVFLTWERYVVILTVWDRTNRLLVAHVIRIHLENLQ